MLNQNFIVKIGSSKLLHASMTLIIYIKYIKNIISSL